MLIEEELMLSLEEDPAELELELEEERLGLELEEPAPELTP